jgi:hypothetical protein
MQDYILDNFVLSSFQIYHLETQLFTIFFSTSVTNEMGTNKTSSENLLTYAMACLRKMRNAQKILVGKPDG